MGIGALNYQGVKGGIKLNDVIEEFKYVYQGQTIKAGDFVEYVNGVASGVSSTSSETTISTSSSYKAQQTLLAVQLTENKFVIFGCGGTVAGSATSGWAVVGTFENATIQLGTIVSISYSTILLSYLPSAIKISENSILLVGATSSDNYLCGVVVTISGTTISLGDTYILNAVASSGRFTSCITCDDNKVFITHEHGNTNPHMEGMVCTISGTTITVGTNKNITSGTWVIYATLGLLERNKIFVGANDDGDNRGIYGYICTIEGTTITKSTEVSIGKKGNYYGYGTSAAVLSPNKVVLSYGKGANNFNLYGMVCTIDGTTVTTGTNTLLSDTKYADKTSILKVTEDKAFVFVASYSTNELYGVFYLINGTTITLGTLTKLSTNSYTGSPNYGTLGSLMLADNNALVVWKQPDPYYGSMQLWKMDTANNIPTNQITVNKYEKQAKLATKPPFNGIALSNGVGGTTTAHNEQVKIARPPSAWDYQPENLLINADFNDGINNWASSISQISPTVIEENGEKILVNTATSTMTASAYTYYRGGSCQNFNQQNGEHIYYASVYYKGKTTNTSTDGVRLAMCSTSYTNEMGEASSSKQSEWKLLSMYGFFGDSSQFCLYGDVGNTATVGDQYFYKQPKLYDLTAHYGAGNEPTQEWCDNNL